MSFAARTVGLRQLIATLATQNVTANSTSPTTSTVTLNINSAGTWSATASGGSTSGTGSGTWMTQGQNTDFEVRMTGSGTTPSGTALNTWFATTSNRSWTLATATGSDVFSFTGTLDFRDILTTQVVASVSVTLAATQI